jgi:hypothetical protein
MTVKIEKVSFRGWKNCVKIADEKAEAIVSADFGPRILFFGMPQGKNHLYVDDGAAGKKFGKDEFAFYGGHRTWHAPERSDRNYIADNNECEVVCGDNFVTVTAPLEKETATRRAMKLTLADDVLTVSNIIENRNLFDVKFAAWGITQLVSGGSLVVPTDCPDTGLVANRAVSLWSYSDMNDERIYWGSKYIAVTPQDKPVPPLKFGFTSAEKKCVYFNHDQAFVMESQYGAEGEFPDFGCNFECYSGRGYIEAEWLSPMRVLRTGEILTLNETWRIADKVSFPDIKDEVETSKAVKSV